MTVNKKTLQGEVVSRQMAKTVVVKVVRTKRHLKYHKQYSTSKRFKAHDESGECQVGDKVFIEESRPLSKDKRWTVIQTKNKDSEG